MIDPGPEPGPRAAPSPRRIAVAGGTGTVGRLVVATLAAQGHEPVVLSRARGTDLLTGQGLREALAGVDAVVDVTNVATTGRRAATAFFTTVSRTLHQGCRDAGVRHHVTLSIAGVDRVPWGYYQAKLAQEQLLLEAAGGRVSVLRAAQFHEFAEQMLQRMRRGPLTVVPRMRSRPVAAAEVAGRLVDVALGEPAGGLPEFGGPQVEDVPDMVARLAHREQVRTRVMGIRLPGAAGAAMAGGGLLPVGDGPRGRATFAQWLSASGTDG
ncbi:MAG: SDR family oxidoreductase [Kineosporiaceae bacterium]